MKFSPGDPVWVKAPTSGRESPAFIVRFMPYRSQLELQPCWEIEVPGCPSTHDDGNWTAFEQHLRPRRDDYQQHEPKITRADLDCTINTPLDKEKLTLESGSIWGN